MDFDYLPTVLDDHRDFRKTLEEMMMRTGLISHWKDNIYLVPSMVNKRKDTKQFIKCYRNVECHCYSLSLSTFNRIVKKIQSTNPSLEGVRYKFGLTCDLCSDETNKPCQRHKKKACPNGNCVHIWDLKRSKEPLNYCQRNDAAVNTSKLHEIAWVKVTGKSKCCF